MESKYPSMKDYVTRAVGRFKNPNRKSEVLSQEREQAIIGLALLNAKKTISYEVYQRKCAEHGNAISSGGRDQLESICCGLSIEMKHLKNAITTIDGYIAKINQRIKEAKDEDIRKIDERAQTRKAKLYA